MTESPLAAAQRLFTQAVDALREVAGAGSGAERVAVLRLCEATSRQLDHITVATVAGLDRDGVFAARGYRSATQALADLLGWERFEARRRTSAAEQVVARVGLDGSVLPVRLPATAGVFAAGRTSLRHVEVIARLLDSRPAGRLSPGQWADAEARLADWAGDYTPAELDTWGTALIDRLDQDGEAPDDRPPAPVNELVLTRLRDGGGKLKGRFDDAAMFDAIAAVLDAHARPLTADDDRSQAERQAAALADVCGYVLDHGSRDMVPDAGGHRPHVTVLIRLDDLENRANAACLDFGGPVAPEALRMLCCDAAVIPIVLTAGASRSMSGGPPAPSPTGYAARSPPATVAAPTPAATGPCPGPRSTTSGNGSSAGRPSSTTWWRCAAPTTARSIPRTGSCGSATAYRSSSRRNGSTSMPLS